MANRYWVGVSNPGWDNNAGTKWAATSGGAGGQSAPGAGDDVFIDANSSAGDPPFCIVTLTANVEIKSLTLTGFTGQLVIGGTPYTLTINGGGLTVPGGVSFVNSGIIKFTRTTGSNTISGMAGECVIDGVGGSFTIQSDANMARLRVLGGSVTIATDLTSIRTIESSGTNVRSLSLASSVLTFINGTESGSPIVFSGSNLTFDAGTSTMNFTGTTNSPRLIAGGGKTFYDVNINEDYTISGANGFHNLNIAASKTVTFPSVDTQTISGTFTANGSAGNLCTIRSTTTGTQHILSAAAVSVSYDDVKDSQASGAAARPWNPANSVNSGNNVGWFVPTGIPMMFLFQ